MQPLVIEYGGARPRIAADAFVAPNATLVGDVEVGAGASVWFGAVLRADEAAIVVGPGCNVQDNAVLHTNVDLPTVLVADVTVGHAAVLEGCRIEPGALIGMGAVVLNGAVVGAGALVAAGAVVGEGIEIPPGVLAAGVPARVRRPLDESTADVVAHASEHYRRSTVEYRALLGT